MTRLRSFGRSRSRSVRGCGPLAAALFVAVLAWTRSARAEITLRAGASFTATDELSISAIVESTFQIVAVHAQIETYGVDLVADNGSNSWRGGLTGAALSYGPHVLTVTATDILATTASTSVEIVRPPPPPTLEVISPQPWDVATPNLRVKVRWLDHGSGNDVEIRILASSDGGDSGAYTELGQPSRREFDGDLSFQTWDGGYVRLDLGDGWDRWIAVETSPALSRVDSVPGFLYDADAERILYLTLRPDGSTQSFRIRNRSTGADIEVPTLLSPTGFYFPLRRAWNLAYDHVMGRLTSRGAMYARASGGATPYGFWEFADGATLELSNSPRVVVERGDACLWAGDFDSGGVPGHPEVGWAVRSHARKITTRIIDVEALPQPDLSEDGDVIYGGPSHELWRIRDGVRTLLLASPETMGAARVEGDRILYPSSTDAGQSLMFADGAQPPVVIANVTGRSLEAYELNGGWIAFSAYPASGGFRQIWRRSPAGELSQVTFLGQSSDLEGLAPDGSLIARRGDRRYLYAAGGRPEGVDIGHRHTRLFDTTAGDGPPLRTRYGARNFWIGNAWHTAIGGVLFRIDACRGAPCGGDAGAEAGTEGGIDAGTDASADGGIDVDASVDAGTNPGVDAGSADAPVDGGSGGEGGANTDADADGGIEPGDDGGDDTPDCRPPLGDPDAADASSDGRVPPGSGDDDGGIGCSVSSHRGARGHAVLGVALAFAAVLRAGRLRARRADSEPVRRRLRRRRTRVSVATPSTGTAPSSMAPRDSDELLALTSPRPLPRSPPCPRPEAPSTFPLRAPCGAEFLAGPAEASEGCAMSLNVYDLSVGLFVRGLTNLKTQLKKAEDHAAASGSGEAALLDAQLAAEGRVGGVANDAPFDLHTYTLAAQVHWAAEGAKLAIARLLGAAPVPAANDAKSFADLHQRLDATIAYLREIAPSDLEAGLDRAIVIEHRRGSMRSSGSQFLIAFAIPHFFYHVTTAYGILRNQGVQLTMGDFLGNWGTS